MSLSGVTSDPAQAGASSSPLAPRERLWTLIGVSTTYGPLDLPPIEDLRRAATMMAREFPAARLAHRLDLASAQWHDAPGGMAAAGRAAIVVHEGPGPQEMGVSAYNLLVQAYRPPDVPLRFVVSGPFITILLSHAVGDAGIAIGAVSALLSTARTGALPAWIHEAPTPHPLRLALKHHYLFHPRRLADTLVAARPLPTPRGVKGPERSVDPAAESVHSIVGKEQFSLLKEWRRDHATGSSMTAIYAVLAERALREVGLPPRGGPTVLFDARRYLPSGSVVLGNFVAGIDLPTAGEWSVRGLSDAIQGAVDAGRPLSAMTVGATLMKAADLRASSGGRARSLDSAGWSAPVNPRPLVAVSSVRNPALDRLSWTSAPEDSVDASLLTAAPAAGLTVVTVQVRGVVYLSLSFHSSVFSADAIAEAARLMATEPVRLLGASTT